MVWGHAGTSLACSCSGTRGGGAAGRGLPAQSAPVLGSDFWSLKMEFCTSLSPFGVRVQPPCHPSASPGSPALLLPPQRCHQRRRGHLGQVGRSRLGSNTRRERGVRGAASPRRRRRKSSSGSRHCRCFVWERSPNSQRLQQRGGRAEKPRVGDKEGMGLPRAERAQPRPCPISCSIPHPKSMQCCSPRSLYSQPQTLKKLQTPPNISCGRGGERAVFILLQTRREMLGSLLL